MQHHLSSATPLSHFGKGGGEKKEGSSLPCIKLSLGCGGSSHVIKEEEQEEEKGVIATKSLFTAAQLHELQLQAVIFKYIVSGLPIPFHLFFPIWNSVFSSLGSAGAGLCKLYPTLGRFDYMSMMDPEPGRCRRTDGKKWRCKKDVVPGQKYCGQHMHRGRRSRKPVEISENVSKSDDKRSELYDSSGDRASKISRISVIKPSNSQSTVPTSNTSNGAPASTKTASLSSASRNNQNNSNEDSSANPNSNNSCNSNGKRCHTTCSRENIMTCQRTLSYITADAECRISVDRSNSADSKNIGSSHISPSRTNQKQIAGGTSKCDALVPVFGLSAKNDFQHITETEPHRCRRSDGKKWRCSKDVIPHQKYCESHMHRGAKKIMVASDSMAVTVASKASTYEYRHHDVPKNDGIRRDFNTNLSISMVPSPRHMTKDEDDGNSNNTSTSDATTITDEIPALNSH